MDTQYFHFWNGPNLFLLLCFSLFIRQPETLKELFGPVSHRKEATKPFWYLKWRHHWIYCYLYAMYKKTMVCCIYEINELLQRKQNFISACNKNILNSGKNLFVVCTSENKWICPRGIKRSIFFRNLKYSWNWTPCKRQALAQDCHFLHIAVCGGLCSALTTAAHYYYGCEIELYRTHLLMI